MSEKQVTLIGVYKANGGVVGELSYFFGHLVGVRSCSLCDVTHSPVMKKAKFKDLEKRLKAELGITFKLVHMNERNAEELKASSGREPCVLLRYDDGGISMLLDYVELKAIDGSVESFEKLLRSRLDFYL
ncbi:hypothetical protein HRU87_01465 [Aquiluna borgnonia]|uniref:Uncharacterized protein n=1 Tax=Aquiluna borgnonia TaxID=2499157 RepID=A0A7D4Q5N9_9MICO|nr:hypothetical protein [Aquiluna borgnonia]QKJ24902.1 hypothetical protein HRU87_01465 [Aquiluna borgnonia]